MNFGIKSVNIFSKLLQLTLQCVFSGTRGSPCLLAPLLLTDVATQWKEGGFCWWGIRSLSGQLQWNPLFPLTGSLDHSPRRWTLFCLRWNWAVCPVQRLLTAWRNISSHAEAHSHPEVNPLQHSPAMNTSSHLLSWTLKEGVSSRMGHFLPWQWYPW